MPRNDVVDGPEASPPHTALGVPAAALGWGTTSGRSPWRCGALFLLCAALSLPLWGATGLACGPQGGDDPQDAQVPDDGEASSDASVVPDGAPLPDASEPDAYVPECGNSIEDDDEVCDDGNLANGDGCNATCSMLDGQDAVAATFTSGDQLAPALAVSGTRATMVWTDQSGVDGDGAGVRVRFFGADGVPTENVHMSTDFDVPANTTTTGDQYQPALAVAADGRYVVVWTDNSGAAGGGVDVRAQMFDSDGSRLSNPQTGTADFVVNSTATGTQQDPAVAVADSGLILITWSDDSATGGDTSGWAVRGRLFNFDGVPQTNPEVGHSDDFLVNVSTTGSQGRPAVVPLGSTSWAVAWTDDTNHDPSGTGIVGTILGTLGSHLVSADALVNSTTDGNQDHVAITTQPGVGMVLAWSDDSRGADDPFFRGIRARALDLSGAPRTNGVTGDTNDFPVNTLVQGSQMHPSLDTDPTTGNIIVMWQDGSASDGSWAGIRGRLFGPALTPLATDLSSTGEDFQVNTTTLEAQLRPAVVVFADQVFGAWEDNSHAPPDLEGSTIRYRFLPPLW